MIIIFKKFKINLKQMNLFKNVRYMILQVVHGHGKKNFESHLRMTELGGDIP